jgi:uncharacterized phage protein gp47/JayE
MPFGLTSTGFLPETLAQVQADIQAALQSAFGADIDLSPTGPFGALAGIHADREAPLWQLGQAIYAAMYPDSATGAALDDLCAITGVVRLPATKSLLSAVLVGTNGTVVPLGTVLATSTAASKFATNAAATIATLTAYATSQNFVVGDLRTNAGNIYSCTTPITGSAAAPTGTGTSIVDAGGTWRYISAGSAAVAVACSATLTGPVAAPAGTLTSISTPVAGFTSVVNPLDAALGTNIESDAALRLRRSALLRAQGNSTLAAIQADILDVSGVTAALAFENDTDLTDGFSRPPHSVEVVVQGGVDQYVANALFASIAAGIASFGSYTPQVVVDTAGTSHNVKFTRPTAVPIFVAVTVTRGPSYPTTGDAQVKQAIVDYAAGLIPEPAGGVPTPFQIGETVYARQLVTAIMEQVPGVLDIPTLNIGIAASPVTSTPVVMAFNQLATFDTSRVAVT